jgi:hypothetical protein
LVIERLKHNSTALWIDYYNFSKALCIYKAPFFNFALLLKHAPKWSNQLEPEAQNPELRQPPVTPVQQGLQNHEEPLLPCKYLQCRYAVVGCYVIGGDNGMHANGCCSLRLFPLRREMRSI